MPRLSILLLGSLQILLDGAPVSGFESDKVRALLAYLAVEGERPHRREALAALLWPEHPESTARGSLRNALFNLRSAISDRAAQPPHLLITPQTIQLNPTGDHVVDAAMLAALIAACEQHQHSPTEDCPACRERLEQAVALYRESFLTGFSLTDSASFEEWAALKREQLQRLVLTSLERLAACSERRGETERALHMARRQIELDPLQEQAHRLVMRLLALRGRRGEALAQYEACARILAQELDATPDAETVALHERIRDGALATPRVATASVGPLPAGSIPAGPIQALARSLGLLDERLAQEGPTVPPASALPLPSHQLPPPPADYVGRERELGQLLDAVQHQGVRILGVRGVGGVGKTALALVLAQRLADSYPDAQLYTEMRGTDLEPMDPGQAMAHIVRSLYPLAVLPAGEAALRAFYRSVLWGRRALILLDNVRDRRQVEPLLPPESCLLMVTSRWRFALPGLRPLDLEAQPLDQAMQMLRTIAPRINQGEARELAQVCGGLPLALRVAGSALAEQEDLPVADYLQMLRAAQDRLPRELEPVESSLAASDALLGESLRQHWYALSIFPDTFDRTASAAVWGLPEAQAQSSLGELVRHSLLSYDRGRARYRLYDLCRVYILARLGEGPAQKARSRHAAHYAQVSQQAHQGYLRGREDMVHGLALLDLERRNIEAGQAWAAWHAEKGEGEEALQAARLCVLYANMEYGFLDLRLSARLRRAWQEAGLSAARRLQDEAAEVNCQTLLGFAHRDLGDAPHSMGCYEQALDLARQIGDRRAEGLALAFVGKLYEDLGQMRRALGYYEKSLAIAQEVGDRRREKIALNGLGTAHAALAEYPQAIDYHERNLVIQRELGDRRGEGYNLGGLARAYHMLGQIDRALVHYQEQLDVAHDIGYGEEISKALRGLGLAHLEQGDVHQAVDDLEKSLSAAREIGNHREEGSTLVSLGEAYLAQGEEQRAAALYEEAMQLAREKGDPSIEGDALWSQSLGAERLGNRVRALEMAERALAVYEQIEHYRAERVRQQLADWRKEGAASRIAGDVVLPLHQLPPPPADFVGRERELRQLLDAVEKEGAHIVAVRGLGGMGKTSLALRLAERLAEHYPDGHLHIEMHGLDAHPLAPAEAMAHVIRSYQPQVQLPAIGTPAGDAALATMYRSVLQGQRALILLDNVRDRVQVESLLPPATCLLLITTRWRFVLPGLRALDLEAQPLEQAVQMLRAIAPRLGREEAGELARACGGLPLALRVMGSALAEWEDLPVEEYMAKLRAAQGRLPEELIAVESSLALSDALISDALRARWYAMAVFPETFGRTGAQAAWGLESAAEAQHTLGELLRYSLVEYDPKGKRYHLHDLCRAYAAARLEPEAAEAARARHAAHYAQVYREADRLYLASGFDAAVLKLYDREWANIVAGQAWAAIHVEGGRAGAQRYLGYVPPALGSGVMLVRLLWVRLHAQERVSWWEMGLHAARQVDDHDAEMRCLLWLSMSLHELGQFHAYRDAAQQALDIASAMGHRGGQAAALHQLSIACTLLGGPESAIAYSEQCLALTRELGWPLVEALALRVLAFQYLELEQPHQGLEYAQQAWAITCGLSPAPPHKAYVLQMCGRAYTEAGEPRRGLEDSQNARALFHEWGFLLWEGYSLLGVGIAYRALGELGRAEDSFEQVLAIGHQINARLLIVEALDELGQLWAAQGGETTTGNMGGSQGTDNATTTLRALGHYQRALPMWREIGGPLGEGRTLWHMSLALDALGERARAIGAAAKALALLAPLEHPAAERVQRKLVEWGDI